MRFWGYHKYMQAKTRSLTIILLIVLSSLACNLSAPTPQAWVQTPSDAALASTQTVSALSHNYQPPHLSPKRSRPLQPRRHQQSAEDGPCWFFWQKMG